MTHNFSLLLLAETIKSCSLLFKVGFFTSDGHENRKNRDETKIETRDTSEEDARKRVVLRHLAGTHGGTPEVIDQSMVNLTTFVYF